MKKVILSSFFVANILFASGIPVVDGANLAQTATQNLKQIDEWVKEANRWAETTTHYQSQLDAYAKQLATQSGVRDVTSFLKVAKSLYDEANKLGTHLYQLKDFNTDIKGNLASEVKRLMLKFYEYDYCANLVDTKRQNSCYQEQTIPLEQIILYNNGAESMATYQKNIKELAKKLSKSKDIKESSDLNNAIQAQVALMQAEKMQIDLNLGVIEASKKALQENNFGNFIKKQMGTK